MSKENNLFKLCIAFRNKHKISCPETISQVDGVIEDAYDFIEEIMNEIGYYQYGEDE